MSKRRKPGEIVKRAPNSGFIIGGNPKFLQVPYDPDEESFCLMCPPKDRANCREYANLRVIGGPYHGKELYHVSECQMEDADPKEVEEALIEAPIKIFDYYPEIDAFLCTKEYKRLAEILGVAEWTPVCWLTRLIARDQDFGEHMFDNWDERAALRAKGIEFEFPEGEDWDTLLIVNPFWFTESHSKCMKCMKECKRAVCIECGSDMNVGADGPCHSDEIKKKFWTDVFKSMEISFDTLLTVAREDSFFLSEWYEKSEGEKPPKLEDQIELAKQFLIKGEI